MSGLVLTLKPNEKFLVNGALLENGPKRSQIRISSPDTHILRMTDAILPNQVNSPVTRVYYAAQLVLSGDTKADNVNEEICKSLEALRHVFAGLPIVKNIDKAFNAAQHGKYYSVLCSLKSVIPVEAALLTHPSVETTSPSASGYAMAV